MARKEQARISPLAETSIREARSKIAAYLREPKITRKAAITLVGEIKTCLDRAASVYDPFNPYIGEKI